MISVKNLFVILIAVGLSGCGGGGSGSGKATTQQEAKFVDGAVENLQYRCGDNPVALTGNQGVLQCPAGSLVTFSVGSVVLGSATLVDDMLFITPAHLAGEGADEQDDMVVNLSRFLISLDADQALENGIQIAPESLAVTDLMLDFTLAPADFAASAEPVVTAMTQTLNGGPFMLVSAEEAQEHVVLALFLSNAGYYEGEVKYGAGDESRKLAFIASRTGAIYGTHMTADGRYAQAGFDEEVDHLSSIGIADNFKIDGSTGATLLLDVSLVNGRADGTLSEQAYPIFSASRMMAFDPVVDSSLVESLTDLMPVSINIGTEDDPQYFGFDDSLTGVPFASFELTPPVEDDPLEYWDMNMAEVVSTRDGILRLIAISMNGYVMDISFDFNTEPLTVVAQWQHIYKGWSGTSSDIEFHEVF